MSKFIGLVSAYAYAKSKGYTGTEEEFAILMAEYASVTETAVEAVRVATESARSAAAASSDVNEAAATVSQQAAQVHDDAETSSESAATASEAKETAVDKALDSEAWALGTRDGEDVGAQDETYHNNAKYYAEQGGASAQTASDAAQTATQKAGEAAQSASAAAESARTLTIDATLTQSGQAADAKATGDKNDVLKSALGYGFYRQADITGDINDADVGISRVTATAGHNPSGKVGFVITMARTAGSRAQIFVNEPVETYPEKCRLFARFLYNNNWSAWVEFADKTDLDMVWINGTDYNGDLNSAPNGFTRVTANATNNPAGDVGYLLTFQRTSTAKGQIFWNSSNFYFRLSTSGTWLDWQSAKNTDLTDRHTGFTFGDSLMAQDGKVFAYNNPQYNVSEIGSMCVGWQTLLHNKFGVTITNYAIGGQDIAAQKPVIKSKTYTNVDFVVISVGVNDYSNNVALGQLPASRNATFTSGRFIDDLCDSIEYILNQNPKIKILLFTPCQRDTTWRNGGVADFSQSATDIYTPNGRGLYLKDYAQAIRDVGAMYSCVVCDMYANGGLNYLTLPTYTFEGVHPTNEGYEFTAPVLYEAFKKL